MRSTESIDIWCDAPPYPVVEGCWTLGIRNPQDVRWCHIDRFRPRAGGWSTLLGALSWLWRPSGDAKSGKCSCGAGLPHLEPFRLLFDCDDLSGYRLGQCERCGTVFWEENPDEQPVRE